MHNHWYRNEHLDNPWPLTSVTWSLLCLVATGLLAAGLAFDAGEAGSWSLLRNTMLLSAGSCAVSLPLGTALAIILMRTDVPWRRGLLLLVIALLFVPLYLVAAAWDAGFGQLGWYSLEQGGSGVPWLSGWRGAIWVHGLAAVPWVALLLSASAGHVERSLEEEALLCGTPGQVLWHVTLRRMAPAVVVAALWVLLGTAGEMTVADLYRVRTFAEVLYTGFALGDDLAQSYLRVLPSTVAVAVLVVAGFAVAASVRPQGRTALRPAPLFRLGAWRWLMLAFLLLTILLIVGIPLGSLVYKAGLTVQQIGAQRVRVWSVAALAANLLGVPGRYGEEFAWTAVLAAATATISLALGLPLAWLARRGGWRSVPAVAVAALGLSVPSPLVGLLLIQLLNRPFPPGLVWLYDQTLFAPIAATLARVLPIAVLLAWYVLRTVGQDVLDAAACDGAGPGRRFWSLALPARLVPLTAVWLVAFAVAAGDLACSILVVPAGVTTVPIRVFGLLHAGVDDQVASICLVMLAGVLATGGLAVHLLPGRRERHG